MSLDSAASPRRQPPLAEQLRDIVDRATCAILTPHARSSWPFGGALRCDILVWLLLTMVVVWFVGFFALVQRAIDMGANITSYMLWTYALAVTMLHVVNELAPRAEEDACGARGRACGFCTASPAPSLDTPQSSEDGGGASLGRPPPRTFHGGVGLSDTESDSEVPALTQPARGRHAVNGVVATVRDTAITVKTSSSQMIRVCRNEYGRLSVLTSPPVGSHVTVFFDYVDADGEPVSPWVISRRATTP